jgi:hypothetical protein
MPYTSIGMVHMDPPEPIPYWDRTMMFADLPEDALAEFVALTGPDSGCPLVSVEIRQLGGAMDREPAVPNAVSTRGLRFALFSFGAGGPDQADLMNGYLTKLKSGLAPWAHSRMMINFVSADEGTTPAELRVAYGEETYDRLARIKGIYDPRNLFRMNHNIEPA